MTTFAERALFCRRPLESTYVVLADTQRLFEMKYKTRILKFSLTICGESAKSPGEGKHYPPQYSGLENSMEYIVHGVAKNQTQSDE